MTFEIIVLLRVVAALIGLAVLICRCMALALLLPGATRFEYLIVYRVPKMANYNDKGKQLITWCYWLAPISLALMGASIYFETPAAS